MKTGDQGAHVAGALTAAALAVGRNAYYAGENIERAVTVAGYSTAIARGVYEYFTRVPELQQQSQSQDMSSSGQQYKRGRYYDAYKGKGRRQTIPVAPSVKTYVKRCMGRLVEKKYVDGTVTFTNATAAGTVAANYLCGIQLGTADSSRIGNNIRVTRIWVRGEWSMDGSFARGDCRIVAGWDRQPNGAAPTNTNIVAQSVPYGPFNHDYVVGHGGSRFEIVSDQRKVWNLQIAASGMYFPYKMFWKGNKIVRFGGNAGTVADMVQNNFFIVMQDPNAVNDFAGYITIEYEDA